MCLSFGAYTSVTVSLRVPVLHFWCLSSGFVFFSVFLCEVPIELSSESCSLIPQPPPVSFFLPLSSSISLFSSSVLFSEMPSCSPTQSCALGLSCCQALCLAVWLSQLSVFFCSMCHYLSHSVLFWCASCSLSHSVFFC